MYNKIKETKLTQQTLIDQLETSAGIYRLTGAPLQNLPRAPARCSSCAVHYKVDFFFFNLERSDYINNLK